MLAGVGQALAGLAELGVRVLAALDEGAELVAGQRIVEIDAGALQVAQAEEQIIGHLAKASGIATAARRARDAAAGRIQVVAGAWKKMPLETKAMIRHSVEVGGLPYRITEQPFLYLDKNYVRMFGGIRATLDAVAGIPDRIRAIQLKGETGSIAFEAGEAISGGAHIIMVDTGRREDLREALRARARAGAGSVKIAFAGGIHIAEIPRLAAEGVDVLDIGTQIVDAPLLPMRFDVRRT